MLNWSKSTIFTMNTVNFQDIYYILLLLLYIKLFQTIFSSKNYTEIFK